MTKISGNHSKGQCHKTKKPRVQNTDYWRLGEGGYMDGTWDLKTHMDGIYIQEHLNIYPDVESSCNNCEDKLGLSCAKLRSP